MLSAVAAVNGWWWAVVLLTIPCGGVWRPSSIFPRSLQRARSNSSCRLIPLSSTSHWRNDFKERLASYGYEYAYAVVLGFNMPTGVHWSSKRRQYVARQPADTRRGGGIFLHVQRSTYTAGCVAAPLDDVRWIVRRLDPAASPRIVMGPTDWVKRRY